MAKRARERQRRDTPIQQGMEGGGGGGGGGGVGHGPGLGQGLGLSQEMGQLVVVDELEKSSVREGDTPIIVRSGGSSVNGGERGGSVNGGERGGGNIITTPIGWYPMLVPYKVNLMLAPGQGLTPGQGQGLASGVAQGQGLGQGPGTLTPPRLSQASGPGLGPAEISSLTVASYHTALMLSSVTSTITNPLPTVYTEPPPAQVVVTLSYPHTPSQYPPPPQYPSTLVNTHTLSSLLPIITHAHSLPYSPPPPFPSPHFLSSPLPYFPHRTEGVLSLLTPPPP